MPLNVEIEISGDNSDNFHLADWAEAFTLNEEMANSNVPAFFTPLMPRGDKIATIVVRSNDPDEEESILSYDLTGITTAPDLEISDYNHDFGELPVHQSSEGWNIDVSNSGNAVLTVSSIEMIGQDSDQFSFSGEIGPLNPQQTGTLTVFFEPTTTGSKTARLQISSDSYEEENAYCDLSGESTVQNEAHFNFVETDLNMNLIITSFISVRATKSWTDFINYLSSVSPIFRHTLPPPLTFDFPPEFLSV